MMNPTTKLCGIAAVGVLSLLMIDPARAQSSLPFSISGPGVSASGTLTGNYVTLTGFTDTVFEVTGASGIFSDTNGISGAITGVLPGKTYTAIPDVATHNHDSIDATGVPFPPASYDNILYPNGNSPVVCDPMFYPYSGGQLDIFGLMLKVDLQQGGSGLVNVWSNGNLNDPMNPIGLDYGLSDGPLGMSNGNPLFMVQNYLGDTGSYPTTYTASGIQFAATPEPSALVALSTGIATLPLLTLRRRKQSRSR